MGGLRAVEKKEELQQETVDQIELGGTGQEEQDIYLLGINLKNLESSPGEDQYYWLLAIYAARADRILKAQQLNGVT